MQEVVSALQMDQRTGAQRIADWVTVASLALEPFRLSPIQVAEPRASIVDALPVLDAAAVRLDEVVGARLEAEGRALRRLVAEDVLTCFRSHIPDLSLAPVVEGPVAEAEDLARESMQEVVEIVAPRFEQRPPNAEEANLQENMGPADPPQQ